MAVAITMERSASDKTQRRLQNLTDLPSRESRGVRQSSLRDRIVASQVDAEKTGIAFLNAIVSAAFVFLEVADVERQIGELAAAEVALLRAEKQYDVALRFLSELSALSFAGNVASWRRS